MLVLVLVPAGSSLDGLVYPSLFWDFFRVRFLVDLLVLGVFALHFTQLGRRQVHVLGLTWVLLVNMAISWMIYASEGAVSPYYAGLNLVILAVAVLLPWTFRETVLVCVATLGMYLAACFLHYATTVDWKTLYNNTYFLVLTGIICSTSSYFTARARFNDFRLRHELDLGNKELARSYDKLAELDRLKSEFFANVNHELRTPLTLILSPIEMLLHRDPPIPEDIGQSLAIVKNNGLRLLKLINDMLEINRLEEGKLRIDRKPILAGTFVSGIVESLRYLTTTKKIDLRAQGVGDPIISGDRSRLEKIMINLLTNAIKFTDPGGVVVVGWEEAGEMARIEVRDTGIGIPEKELPHVFDRFRQADGSSTRKYQGVGLGLALTKELIEEHGGTLAVRSRVGEGTVFTVELPLDRGSDAAAVEASETQAAGDDSDPFAITFRAADRSAPVDGGVSQADPLEVGQGRFRVLIVDDEPDMRRFLVSILSDEYRVLQAADGITGLEMTKQHQPDLLLLDLMLPGMDGLDVCLAIQKDEKLRDIKVVLLTARADEGTKVEALDRGASDFLTKPFSSVEVKTRIRNILRTASLQHDVKQRNVELEEALRRLREAEGQLIQSEKLNALGSLAAGLLHEINNPLNFTLTAVQVLDQAAQASDDNDLKETLHDIEDGMKRIQNIITDLRTFAYPQQADKREKFEIVEVVDTAMRFTAHMRNGQQIEQDFEPDSPICGSKTHISQVVLNLLTNALRAVGSVGPKRQPQIKVRSERNGSMLIVRVWDNGVGIAPEVLPRVFDPFYTTQDVGEGMGLGLSICHTIVKNHGGRITVRSEPDQWTEITLELPLADNQET